MRPSYPNGILLFVGYLLLTPAVWATPGKDVAYRSGDETVHGLLFTPAGEGPFPGLLAIHAVFGLDGWTKGQASKLADAGYVVLALDFYQGKVVKTLDEGAQISRAIPMARKQRDVLAAIYFLRSQPNVAKDRVGSIGWCMGGTWSFQLATLDPLLKVAVVRYGHVSGDPSVLGKINAHVLGIFGGKDTSIPVAEIRSFEQQMKNLGKQAEIIIYPEAGHAFEYPENTARELGLIQTTHSAGGAYQGSRPDDTADAWKRTLSFLDTNMKSPDNSQSDKQDRQPLLMASADAAIRGDEEHTSSESAGSVGSVEQEAKQIDQEFNHALSGNDAAALDRIFAHDCIFTNERGMVLGKTQLVDFTRSGKIVFESYSAGDVKVHVYGDAAVVTERGTTKGSDLHHTGQFRFTRVYVKRQARWQLVAAHKTRVTEPATSRSSPVPAPAQPEAKNEHSPAAFNDIGEHLSQTQQEIVQAEKERLQAILHNNVAAMERLLAEEFVVTDVQGIVHDRTDELSLYRDARRQTRSWEPSDVRVRVYGDVAVVTQGAAVKDVLEGERRDVQLRLTHVWVKRDGRWQVVARQAARITGPSQNTTNAATPRTDIASAAAHPEREQVLFNRSRRSQPGASIDS